MTLEDKRLDRLAEKGIEPDHFSLDGFGEIGIVIQHVRVVDEESIQKGRSCSTILLVVFFGFRFASREAFDHLICLFHVGVVELVFFIIDAFAAALEGRERESNGENSLHCMLHVLLSEG
jgi:hypothetical protein